jgi:EAL and modified HD-GYP domain-containing signal transduction protein
MNCSPFGAPGLEAPIYLGRQPIFDQQLNVVAYELLYRDGDDNQAFVGDNDEATSQVLLNTLVEIGLNCVVGSHQAFVNVSPSFLLTDHCAALPPDRVVLELLEGAEPTDSLIAALEELIQNDFRFALDDFSYQPGYDRFLRLASIVKVDVRSSPHNLPEQVARLRPFGVTILAEQVETPAEFDLCQKLGFGLFQGYFFARPRVIAGRGIPSDRLATLRLIAALSDPDISLRQVESLVAREPALVHKLLKFINSTHSGMPAPVKSIHMAIALVGVRKLRTLATLVALGSMKHCPRELIVLANVRARMCETVAQADGSRDADMYFTVGLLSVLDALAGRPMREILDELPLSQPVKAAILDQDGRLGAALQMVLEYEAGHKTRLGDARRPLVFAQLTRAYIDAVRWADTMFNELTACVA